MTIDKWQKHAIIAVKHFTLGGRKSLETAVKIYLIFFNMFDLWFY